MVGKLKSRWVLIGVVALVLLSAACVQLAPMARIRFGEPAAGDAVQSITVPPVISAGTSRAVGTSAANGRGTATVRRGAIADIATVTGRLAGLAEVGLEVASNSRIENVAVRPGQNVEQGQVLVEADSRDIAKDLAAARARVETSQLKLAQSASEDQAKRQEDARRNALEAIRAQSGVAEAQAALDRAQAELERLKAGASESDRAAAQVAVAQATVSYERAQAELTKLLDGPSRAELQSAEQEVATARAALDRNTADLAKLQAGPDPVDVRTAEREVASVETELARAHSELSALTDGPDPAALRSAERDVQRAQTALRDAQAMKADSPAARTARDTAVRSAQNDLQAAQDRLDTVRQPARASDVDIARNKVQSAQLAVDNARDKLERIRRPADRSALDSATLAVSRARSSVENAEARLQELWAGPSEAQLAPARAAVESARAVLDSARAKVAELDAPPSPAVLRDAQARIAAAQAGVARASAEAGVSSGSMNSSVYDRLLLQKGLDQDRAQLESLEKDLAATRLLAPFSGVVTSVNVAVGDQAQRGRPVLSMARPGERIVLADLIDKVSRFSVGQDLVVGADGADGKVSLPGQILQIADSASGAGKVAYLYVDWGSMNPEFGSSVQVNVTLDRHEDALLVPERAVRSNGARRYVEYTAGTSRRAADVQVGIVSGGFAEILKGLNEGQIVLVRP